MPVLECCYDTLVFTEALCRAVLEATWENVVVFQLGLQVFKSLGLQVFKRGFLVFATFMTIHLFCGICSSNGSLQWPDMPSFHPHTCADS